MKFKTVVGVDPSAADKGHGVAIFDDGKLVELSMMKRMELVNRFVNKADLVFSIENVLANNFQYGKHVSGNAKIDKKKMLSVGRCQQSQLELMRDLEYYNIPYLLQAPSSKFKEGSEIDLFKRLTGWDKQSNQDTRSAAYMGFIVK
jgi:hypothetical protein